MGHTQRACLAAAALLVLVTQLSVSVGARQCMTTIESSSPMFGTSWRKSFVTYSQETQWKRHGDMVKLNLYYDSDAGCVVGVKPTYGTSNSLPVRLGTEKTADKVPVHSKHIQLGAREKIVSTHWKAGRCVEYLKISTNQGRFLEIGNKESTAPLKTNKPAAGAFLGFFKGFTDVVNSNAATGALQQLQLFWVLRECDEPAKGSIVTESGESELEQVDAGGAESHGLLHKKVSYSLTEEGNTTASVINVDLDLSKGMGADSMVMDGNSSSSSGTETVILIDEQTGEALAVGTPSGSFLGNLSSSGSSSSSGSGSDESNEGITLPFIGKKFRAKQAFAKLKADLLGTPNGTFITDTANCSLHDACPSGACLTPSCALNGGGKDVLTMMCYGTNLMPHPILDATVGNPCTNLACRLDRDNCTSGPLGFGGFCTGTVVPMGRTAKLHPAGAVWLGHPCIEHKGPLLMLPKLGLGHKANNNNSASFNDSGDYDGNGAYVAKAWKVCDCIKGPGLKAGSLAVDLPDHLEAKLNLTGQILGQFFATKFDKLRLSPVVEKVTEVVDGITEALSMFELSLSLPVKEHLPLKSWIPSLEVNVTELPVMQQGVLGMAMPDVLAQWATAFATKAHLRKYIISQSKLNALRAFVPGFEVPCILVANVSTPLMRDAVNVDMPIYTIPDENLGSVSMLLPNITSLPLVCVPKIMGAQALFNKTFGGMDVHNFTIPSMERVVERLLSVFPPPQWGASIVTGKFAEVASKWMTGVMVDEAIPVVNVTSKQWRGLSSMLPGLNHSSSDDGGVGEPTLLLWNASSLLFTKPRLSLATLVVPSELSGNVSSVCSGLVPGLPALLMPPGYDNSSMPELRLSAVTPLDLKVVLDKLVSGIPGHPAFNLTFPGGPGSILNFTLPFPKPFGVHLNGLLPHPGLDNVLEAFAGFEALKKNLTGLTGMKNVSMDLADQAFVKVLGHNFTGIKLIPGNFSAGGLGEHFAAKAGRKEEGLAALKSLLGPKIAVLKGKKHKAAKVLNITLSQ